MHQQVSRRQSCSPSTRTCVTSTQVWNRWTGNSGGWRCAVLPSIPVAVGSLPTWARLDWNRRHLTMRTHTALHILCGVIWADHRVAVTGGNMDPGKGRLDFPLPSMSAEFGRQVEIRINEEIAAAHEILVGFVGREVADEDHALIRTSANLIPREIDPLRVIDIVGLDKQADGGTHVLSTAEVGGVTVTGTESKGRGNKRVRLEVHDAMNTNPTAS